MPPSPAIAFRTLPDTRTPLTVCASASCRCSAETKKRRRTWSTTHISRAAACCFVWLTRMPPARLRRAQFCRVLASLRVGENFPRLRRAAGCEVTVRRCYVAACRRLTACCGCAFAGRAYTSGTWHASASSRSSAASTAAGCACASRVWTQDRPAPPAPHPARRSLRATVDFFLLGSNLDATGAFSGRSRRA